ncbi:MAG: hypothetical protein Tsb0032_35840 [Kiloniellaceae bacterium]
MKTARQGVTGLPAMEEVVEMVTAYRPFPRQGGRGAAERFWKGLPPPATGEGSKQVTLSRVGLSRLLRRGVVEPPYIRPPGTSMPASL